MKNKNIIIGVYIFLIIFTYSFGKLVLLLGVTGLISLVINYRFINQSKFVQIGNRDYIVRFIIFILGFLVLYTFSQLAFCANTELLNRIQSQNQFYTLACLQATINIKIGIVIVGVLPISLFYFYKKWKIKKSIDNLRLVEQKKIYNQIDDNWIKGIKKDRKSIIFGNSIIAVIVILSIYDLFVGL